MLPLTRDFYERFVLQGNGPVLVACLGSPGAGKDQMEILRNLRQKLREHIEIRMCLAKDNTWFKVRHNILGTPTYLLFQGGKVIDRMLGKTDVDGLMMFINRSMHSDQQKHREGT